MQVCVSLQALEDGRFLVHPDRFLSLSLRLSYTQAMLCRFDSLRTKYSEAELSQRKLVRVHQDFRVVALALPVPRSVLCTHALTFPLPYSLPYCVSDFLAFLWTHLFARGSKVCAVLSSVQFSSLCCCAYVLCERTGRKLHMCSVYSSCSGLSLCEFENCGTTRSISDRLLAPLLSYTLLASLLCLHSPCLLTLSLCVSQ